MAPQLSLEMALEIRFSESRLAIDANSLAVFMKKSIVRLSLILLLFGALPAAGAVSHKDARRALRNGELDIAEKLFRELISKNQRDVEAHLGLSYSLLKKRQFQAAYDSARHALSLDEYSSRGYALLGAALLGAGDFRNSAKAFRTSIDLNPREALAIAGLAMIDLYENRSSASVIGLRRAMQLDPAEPDFLLTFALAAARSERYGEAADAYERFLKISPLKDVARRERIRAVMDLLRYLVEQPKLYRVTGSTYAAAPMRVVDNRPIVDVRLNGSPDILRFVLDTGSAMSVISERTAKRFKLNPVARGGMSNAVGGSGRFEIVYGYISSLNIGDVRVESIPVYIRPFFGDNNVDGYIGLSALDEFITTLDYFHKTLNLERKQGNGSTTTVPGFQIPVRRTSSGFLSAEIKIEGLDGSWNFIVDTGASISVIASSLAAQEQTRRFAMHTQMRIFGAAGVSENIPTLLLPRVALGESSLEKVTAAVLDLDSINESTGFTQHGIIGGNFLSNYRVSFDFQKGVMWLADPSTVASSSGARSLRKEFNRN